MSTVKAKTLLPVKNAGSSVLSTSPDSDLANVVSVGSNVNQLYKTGPVDNNDADKALTAGSFAYNSNTPVAKKLSTMLSGISNDVLLSGAAQPGQRRKVHKIEGLTTSLVTTAIRQGHYNVTTGEFASPFPSGSTDSFGTDDAVTQHELQYRYGAPLPAMASYGEDNFSYNI